MNTQMMTYSGEMFDILNPDPELVHIEDIAHALALTNRYNGHTKFPYSVAQHCVRMAQPDMPGDMLMNLLHDAAEAYVGDIVYPHKHQLLFHDINTSFKEVEDVVLYNIFEGLGLDYTRYCIVEAEVKQADRIMLATEVRTLMTQADVSYFKNYERGVQPLKEKIGYWHWETAEELYLNRFNELIG